MALGVSRGDLSLLASGLCAMYLGTVGAPRDMGMAVVAHDGLFCDDELDLFDRVGQRTAGQCDLATESSAGLGDVGDGLLVSRADVAKRLVDVGLVHSRGIVSFGHGDELCACESIGSVVVASVARSGEEAAARDGGDGARVTDYLRRHEGTCDNQSSGADAPVREQELSTTPRG